VDILDRTGIAGQTVTVTVVTTRTGIAGAGLVVRYDPRLFTYAGGEVRAGSVFTEPILAVRSDTALGELRIAVVSSVNSSSAGPLVTLPLTIAANVEKEALTGLSLEAILNDANGNIIPATVGSGVYTLLPAPSVTPGDANGDGVVNVADVREAIRFLLSPPPSSSWKTHVDMNRDGVVDLTDIRRLLQSVVIRG
jgi:hypothetical protein